MSHSYKLELTFPRNAQQKVLKGEVEDEIWSHLIWYCDEVECMQEVVKCFGFHKITTKLSIDSWAGMSATSNVLPAHSRSALLHALRPFLLQNEPISFDRTQSLFAQVFKHGWINRAMLWQRDHYRGIHIQSKVQIVSRQKGNFISEKVFNDWLYGYEYHRDLDKRKKIEAWKKQMPDGFAEGVLEGMLFSRVEAIVFLSRIIRKIEHADGTPIELALGTKVKMTKLIKVVDEKFKDAEDPEKVIMVSFPV